MPVLMYGSETVIRKEINNLRVLLGIGRMDKVTNAQIRGLCGVMKGLMVFSRGSAMWIELLKGCMWRSEQFGWRSGGLIL